MALAHDIIRHFRREWVRWERPDGDLYLHVLYPGIFLPEVGDKHLVVAEAGILSGYVAEISDLMWDVMEHTEKELWLQVPSGKNVPPSLLNEEEAISIHWARSGVLHDLIFPTGKAAVAIHTATPEASATVLASLENVITLAAQKAPERRAMHMSPDGSVHMLG